MFGGTKTKIQNTRRKSQQTGISINPISGVSDRIEPRTSKQPYPPFKTPRPKAASLETADVDHAGKR
jgi:hypothetical protein